MVDENKGLSADNVAFAHFIQIGVLDCSANPDVAVVQNEMAQQGWVRFPIS
jgi:hypothetical protein